MCEPCFLTGVQAYADSLLVIPKTLAVNSGLDAQETIVKLQEEYASAGQAVGLDIASGTSNGLLPHNQGVKILFNPIFWEMSYFILFFGHFAFNFGIL